MQAIVKHSEQGWTIKYWQTKNDRRGRLICRAGCDRNSSYMRMFSGTVGGIRFELMTSSVSTKRSTPELTAPVPIS